MFEKKNLGVRSSFFGGKNPKEGNRERSETKDTRRDSSKDFSKDLSLSVSNREYSRENSVTDTRDESLDISKRTSLQEDSKTPTGNNSGSAKNSAGFRKKTPISRYKIKSGSGGENGSPSTSRCSSDPSVLPLFEAIDARDWKQLEYLLRQPYNLSGTRLGKTILHEACAAGSVEAVQLILSAKYLKIVNIGPVRTSPLVNEQSSTDGKTALHIACAQGNIDIVRELLAWNPHAYVIDKEGKTPFHYCQDNFHIFALFYELKFDLREKEEVEIFKNCLEKDSLRVAQLIRHVSPSKLIEVPDAQQFAFKCIQRCVIEGWDRIYLSKSNLDVFPLELIQCSNLLSLNLSQNNLTDLPPQLVALVKLEKVDVSRNLLTSIPTCFANMPNLQIINMMYNNLKFPESEIASQGAKAIKEYLKDKEDAGGDASCFEIKVMFVGQENVGKTSLLRALKGEKANQNISTDGISIEVFTGDKKKALPKGLQSMLFRAWDFAGQELYYSTHQFFLSANAIYLLVWDMRKDSSESRVEFWLQSIKARAGSAPVVLVGTHADDKSMSTKRVSEIVKKVEDIFKPKYTNILHVLPVSCIDGRGVKQLKAELEVIANENLLKIPKTYRILEEALIALRNRMQIDGKANTVIDWDQLVNVAKLSGVPTDEAFLVRATKFLHELGSIVHFHEPRLKDLVILDPSWLTKCMATIITTKHSYAKKGFLYHKDFGHIWKSDEFPLQMAEQILHLLQMFEVIHHLPDSDMSLVPWLLPSERPDFKLLWLPWDPSQKQLDRQYRFSFIPAGLMSRIMIRLMQLGEAQLYWRNGIIVQLKQSDYSGRGLVELLPGIDTLRVSVRAVTFDDVALMLHHMTGIVEQLVNDWYQVESDISVPCPQCFKQQIFAIQEQKEDEDSNALHCFSLNDCEKAALDGRMFLQCEKNGVSIRLDRLTPDVTMDDFKGQKVDKKEITFGKSIGKGGFGYVYIGTWKDEEVAVKEILVTEEKGNRTELFGEFRHECWVWSHLKHPNIVELKGFCMSPFLMVMEIVPAGDLYGFLHVDFVKTMEYITENLDFLVKNVTNKVWFEKRKDEFVSEMHEKLALLEQEYKDSTNSQDFQPCKQAVVEFFSQIVKTGTTTDKTHEEFMKVKDQMDGLLMGSLDMGFRLRMALDIALGMAFLHGIQPPLLHRDLKSPNILLKSRDPNAEVIAKVADFGLSSGLYIQSLKAQDSNYCVANPTWVAPEILSSSEYSEASDTYAFGIICWELLTRRHPFAEISKTHLNLIEEAIKSGRRPTIPSGCPVAYSNLVNSLWVHQPEKRMPFRHVVNTLTEELLPTFSPEIKLPKTVKVSLRELKAMRQVNHKAEELRSQAIEGQCLLKLKIGQNDESKCHCLAQANNFVLGGSASGQLFIWNAENGHFVGHTKQSNSHTAAVNTVIFIKKDSLIWSGSDDRSIKIWELTTKIDQYLEAKTTKSSFLYYYEGKSLLKGKQWKKRWVVLDKTEKQMKLFKEKDSETPVEVISMDSGSCTSFSPDSKKPYSIKIESSKGTIVLAADTDDEINSWSKSINSVLEMDMVLLLKKEMKVGKRISCFILYDHFVWATSTSDRIVRVWDAATHNMVKEIDTSAIASHLNGTLFSMLTIDDFVWIAIGTSIVRVNAKTFEPLEQTRRAAIKDERLIINSMIAIPAVYCDPKRSQVWTCKNDNKIDVWDVESGTRVSTLESDDVNEKFLCLLRVGESVWSVDREGSKFHVWSIVTGNKIRSMNTGHKDAISALLLVWDRTVWSASWDSYIHIWK